MTVELHEPTLDSDEQRYFHPTDLERIWAELNAAAGTDALARKFVEYFAADGERLFGTTKRAAQIHARPF